MSSVKHLRYLATQHNSNVPRSLNTHESELRANCNAQQQQTTAAAWTANRLSFVFFFWLFLLSFETPHTVPQNKQAGGRGSTTGCGCSPEAGSCFLAAFLLLFSFRVRVKRELQARTGPQTSVEFPIHFRGWATFSILRPTTRKPNIAPLLKKN